MRLFVKLWQWLKTPAGQPKKVAPRMVQPRRKKQVRTRKSATVVDMSTHPLTLAKCLGAARVYAASYHDPALMGQVIVSVDVGKAAERSHAAWEKLRPTMELADGKRIALTCIRQTRQSGDRILCYATPEEALDHEALKMVRRIMVTHRGQPYYANCG